MRSTPLAEGETWPRLCAAELGGLRRLRRKQRCGGFRVELKVLSGRRTGLRGPPPRPGAPSPAWEPCSACPAAPPPPSARPPPPAASPRPRPGEASGVSPEIKALQQTRRLLANARERTRVHTISAAFEALRKQVPAAGRRLGAPPGAAAPRAGDEEGRGVAPTSALQIAACGTT